jgi:hypothetical protein
MTLNKQLFTVSQGYVFFVNRPRNRELPYKNETRKVYSNRGVLKWLAQLIVF